MPDQSLQQKRYVTNGVGVPRSNAQISHAVVVNDACYVGGQLSVDKTGCYQRGDIRQEAKRAFENLFATLQAAGFTPDDVVYLELAFDDLDDLSVVSELYNQLFHEKVRPCRTVSEVFKLPYGALFRVSGVAIKGPSKPNSAEGS